MNTPAAISQPAATPHLLLPDEGARCQVQTRMRRKHAPLPSAWVRILSQAMVLPCLMTMVLAGQVQIELVPDPQPQTVFSGGTADIRGVFRNASSEEYTGTLSLHLFQATSATAVLLTNAPWKELRVLPGQTVLESAKLELPAIRGDAPEFIVQWVENGKRVVGKTRIQAVAKDVLQGLKQLSPDNPIGLLDPVGDITSVIADAGIERVGLDLQSLAEFKGKLVVVSAGEGPSSEADDERVASTVKTLAGGGVGVVWAQRPARPGEAMRPSFRVIQAGKGVVVAVDRALIANLRQDPRAQRNLVQLARLATNTEPSGTP